MLRYSEKIRIVATCLIFMAVTFVSFEYYLHRTLKGDLNYHILAGERFGTPAELKAKGIKPLYFGLDSGWDGQFYYYIANDLFAQKDTPNHLDAPSYRYQRVGLSLYTAIVAKLALQNWVSPALFFFSYAALVLAATLVGARLLAALQLSPYIILLWALSVGTQITLFNALPDAAADAFLIFAISLWMANRFLPAAVAFSFAALSREIYVLFPICIAAAYLFDRWVSSRSENRPHLAILMEAVRDKRLYWAAVPVVLELAWQAYITLRFGVTASSEAHGILGLPLVAWFDYFRLGLEGNHPIFTSTKFALYESTSLFLLLLVLIATGVVCAAILRHRESPRRPVVYGLAFATFLLVVLYACFGPTVIAHYTGYVKAESVFFVLIPVLTGAAHMHARIGRLSLYVVAASLAFTTFFNWQARILPFRGIDDITKMSTIERNDRIACFGAGSYQSKIDVKGLTVHSSQNLLSRWFGRGSFVVVDADVTNASGVSYISTANVGSVLMSSQWLDQNDRVAMDGIRSALVPQLGPGETARVRVISYFPRRRGSYTLRLSLVQEGCAWFYQVNPTSSQNIHLEVE